MLGAAVVTAIAGPLVEPVVHVAVLVGVVVMERPLLRFLFVVLIFARLLVILFLIGRFRLRRPGRTRRGRLARRRAQEG